jgi:hypothetical protein
MYLLMIFYEFLIFNYFFVILAILAACLRDFSLIFNAARLSISSCDKGLRPLFLGITAYLS